MLAASCIEWLAIIMLAYEYKLEYRPGADKAYDGLSFIPLSKSTWVYIYFMG